ncbi:WD40-repeat-containing domain protein [Baffinella frigidus]|nr:WD40-repeat-containing domain protein [Cryptophyta sp. CCMP2293]
MVVDGDEVRLPPGGGMLAVGAGPRIVKLLNVSTGEVRLGATGHTSEVLCIALSPCGAILASAGKDCSWHLWDVARACVCTMGEDGYFDAATSGCPVGGHSEAVQAIAVSPCGARVATGGWDTQVIVWDAPTRQEVIMWDARTGAEQLQMLSHERLRVASCSWDGAVFIWSAT